MRNSICMLQIIADHDILSAAYNTGVDVAGSISIAVNHLISNSVDIVPLGIFYETPKSGVKMHRAVKSLCFLTP